MVTSNDARSSSAGGRHRNPGDFEPRLRGRRWTRQVVRGGRLPTQADTIRSVSWVVSCGKLATGVGQ